MVSLTIVGSTGAEEAPSVEDQDDASSLTRNESIVHAALKDAERPMKAYELLDHLHDAGLRAPMTIYRALEGLQAKGYAQKIVSRNAYISIDEPAADSFRAILTCRRCGDAKLVPLSEDDVRRALGGVDVPIAEIVFEAIRDCDGLACAID